MDILVTYDISTIDLEGERRLARVAAVCERYGQRVQYSVFECRLDDIRYQRLVSELSEELDATRDSINLYRLRAPVGRSRHSLGRRGYDWSDAWVL